MHGKPIKTVENNDTKRKAVIYLNLDESFEVEYYENNRLVHSYEAVGQTFDSIRNMVDNYVISSVSPELLEG